MWLVDVVRRRSRGSDWRGRFLVGCVALLALMLTGASWSAFRSAKEREIAQQHQTLTLEILAQTDELKIATLNLLRGERGYLLTGDNVFLEPHYRGRTNADICLTNLAKLTASDPVQRAGVDRLAKDIKAYITVLDELIQLERSGRQDVALERVRRGDERIAIIKILLEIRSIEEHARNDLRVQNTISMRISRSSETYQYLLAGLGLTLLLLSIVATIHLRRAVQAEAAAWRNLQRSAATDELTGIANRRAFIEALDRAIRRARATGKSTLCVAILDIDHFKTINDRFGHPAGDTVLRAVAKRATEALRRRDVVGRLGGEEFGIILPAADTSTAQIACDRMREALCAGPVTTSEAIIQVTASIGVAQLREDDDATRLMARADVALYEAKNGGRNQVRLAA